MAGDVVSRKDKRRQERDRKKRGTRKRQRKDEIDTSAVSKRVRALAAREMKRIPTARGDSSIRNKFHEFLAEAASTKGGQIFTATGGEVSRFVNTDVELCREFAVTGCRRYGD